MHDSVSFKEKKKKKEAHFSFSVFMTMPVLSAKFRLPNYLDLQRQRIRRNLMVRRAEMYTVNQQMAGQRARQEGPALFN